MGPSVDDVRECRTSNLRKPDDTYALAVPKRAAGHRPPAHLTKPPR
mgnify:CR=1 FL=1